MAKQSGIHQLRGKVGEHSYYSQTGVGTGLVRKINQAMSTKVKTDEAFANTRLNNAEFGQAGRIASMLAQYIIPKFRPMILPFSQAKMARILLEYIKQDTTAPWGQRNLTAASSGDAQVAALRSVVKNRFSDLDIQITVDEEHTSISFAASAETRAKLISIGADGCIFRFLASTSWIGTFSATDKKYASSYARANIYQATLITSEIEPGVPHSLSYSLRPAPPEGWPAFQAERMGIMIALPYRNINGTEHILQEHCSFYAFELMDGQVS